MIKNKNIKIYLLLSCLIITLFILSFFKIYIKGEYTSLILSWCWIIYTIYIIVKFWKNKIIKFYSLLLGLLTFLSIIPMAIPFVLIISFLLNFTTKATYKLNDNYSIKQKQYLLDREKLYVNKKFADYLIFEKIDVIGNINYEDILSDFKINREELVLQKLIDNIKLKSISKNSITIDITIDNITKDFEIEFK